MMKRPLQSGFTLWELLVTLIVAGVIFGIGVPSLMEFQRNNAIASASNDFVTAVLAARSEAVKRQLPVTLCASANPLAAPPACQAGGAGTNAGFIVWADEDGDAAVDTGERVLRRLEAPGGAISVFMDNGHIAYGRNGFPRAVGLGEPMSRVLYCDDRGRGLAAGGRSAARLIEVQGTGRAEVVRGIDEVEDGIADLMAAGAAVDCP